MMNASTFPGPLARRLGRDNLSRGRGSTATAYPPTRGHGAAAGIGQNVVGRGMTSASGSARLDLSTGVLSAGLMAGITIGFVAFFLWTRGHQA